MLSRSKRQDVTVKRPRPAVPGNAFEPSGQAISARVLPMSGTATAQMYGLEPSQMRMMMYDRSADVREGDGVCVDVGPVDEPDFRVIYIAVWTRHCVAHLKYIPPSDRGGGRIMRIDVDIDGLDAVVKALTTAGDELMPSAADGMRNGLLAVVKDAKTLCPKDTGELASSIHTEVREYATFAVGDVKTVKGYAPYVEMGTGEVGRASGGNGSGKQVSYRTGGWFVPLKHGAKMIADTEVEGASNGFWTHGQPARPFLYPAFKANKKRILAAIRAGIRKGLSR